MPGASWEPWQIDKLKRMLSKGLSAREMRIGSRTAAAIQNKAARLNLVGDGIARKPWPKARARTGYVLSKTVR